MVTRSKVTQSGLLASKDITQHDVFEFHPSWGIDWNFFLNVKWYPSVWIYHILFINSFIIKSASLELLDIGVAF